MNERIFNSYDMEDLLIPSDNSTVKMQMYWLVKDGKVFQHKVTKVWQCNKNKSIVDALATAFPGVEVVFLPFAYIKEIK
ncbi:hypothetical protein [Escherichia phage BF17]|uniref:Uncharacterized protein n=1 Tax=Escherichia phage fEgEco12 TaxID=3158837 RepID=A0AAU7PH24_9CAUD|nr:hypothetical protein Ecwhy1_84 [Escherichia phage Ecwhy_1]QXN76415.1 hypothetical protein [Escherichia phage BF17]WGM49669.1 hypothetical protein EcMJ_427 [Escherichia phage vB_Ec-M-J]HBB3761116.1 hypothetical protein [Escherichia coli]